MKKLVLLIIIFGLAVLVAYKLFWDKESKPAQNRDQALTISKNSGVFNVSFAAFLSDYFSLKDALVDWDTIKADQAAYRLAREADSLPIKLIKADSSIVLTAESLAASIGGDARGFLGEAGIEEKRRSFNMVTEELYNLIRTVRYDGETIYHVRCPMAFKDSEEGYWLSNAREIVNPYLGNKHPTFKNKMMGCGEIADSVDFAGK
jgi:hypothetical protein